MSTEKGIPIASLRRANGVARSRSITTEVGATSSIAGPVRERRSPTRSSADSSGTRSEAAPTSIKGHRETRACLHHEHLLAVGNNPVPCLIRGWRPRSQPARRHSWSCEVRPARRFASGCGLCWNRHQHEIARTLTVMSHPSIAVPRWPRCVFEAPGLSSTRLAL